MAPRAVSTASISFGLVSIPVKLYSSGNSKASISFNLLSKKGNKLKQQYIDPKDDSRVVERSEMVKGYEYAKDQYVIFTEEELKEMQEKATQSIDITEFVPAESVPQVFLQKTYWLGPDKGGARAYALLSQAMTTSGRNAIAKYAARGKTYLVMLAPHENGIAMHQLYFADEVVPFSEIPLDDIELKEGEIGLAMQLINQIASDDFVPDNYEDDVKKRVEAAIQQKIDGEAVTIAPSEAPKAQIIDLMDALKASLGSMGEALVKAAPVDDAHEGDGEEEEEKKPAKKAKARKAPAKKKASS